VKKWLDWLAAALVLALLALMVGLLVWSVWATSRLGDIHGHPPGLKTASAQFTIA
jgi:hypothetical protein